LCVDLILPVEQERLTVEGYKPDCSSLYWAWQLPKDNRRFGDPDKVCYGDIFITNTVGRNSRVLAFYVANKDEMFIRANLKGVKGNALHTVLHELGHRLHYKFMSGKQREINSLYSVLDRKSGETKREKLETLLANPGLQPQPGDTLELKGKTYIVNTVVYDTVSLRLAEDSTQKASINLLAYMKMKGVKIPVGPMVDFITDYAEKNADENFAEMVAFYCLGQLPTDLEQLLRPLL
jgi:hypothetical protein